MTVNEVDFVDTIHGIEREPDSELFGELVVPFAYMWSQPGIIDADGLTGTLAHGVSVDVTYATIIDGAAWYYVETTIKYKGKSYPQKGWLRASLLKKAGADE